MCYKNNVKIIVQKPDTPAGATALEVTSRPSWMQTCFDFEQIITLKTFCFCLVMFCTTSKYVLRKDK